MSQYPSPYQPQQPTGYYLTGAYTDPLAPAKRSSILMFVLGGILSLCGLCCMGLGPLLSQAQLTPEQQADFNQIEQDTGLPVQTILVGMGVAGVVPGLLLLVLGFFVRGGGMGAVITSIILVSVFILGALVMLIGAIISAAGSGGDPNGLLGGAVFLGIVAMLGLLLVWLIQAAKSSSRVSAQQAQYQMQYWQYQQQQQAYQQPPPPPQPQQHNLQQQLPPQQNWPPPPPPDAQR